MEETQFVFRLDNKIDTKIDAIKKVVDYKRTKPKSNFSKIVIEIDDFKIKSNINILILENEECIDHYGKPQIRSKKVCSINFDGKKTIVEKELELFNKEKTYTIFCTIENLKKKDFDKKIKVKFIK